MTTSTKSDAEAVVRARSLAALRVASRALEFADPVSAVATDPHAWAHAGGELRYLDLEVMHTAVMRMAGVSWEALAEKQEVPRQSLHRRIAKKVERETDLARSSDQREGIGEVLDNMIDRLTRLRETIDEDFEIAAEGVVARSKRFHWWEE